jgi:hypothetical protein
MKKYKVTMTNEDDGRRIEVQKTGTLKECREFLKEVVLELREEETDDTGIKLFEVDEDRITGIGHRGNFFYDIEEKK